MRAPVTDAIPTERAAARPAAPPRPAPGRLRRVLARLAAVGIGCLLALLAGELWVRATVGAPLAERTPLLVVRANPHRGWEMLPSAPHYTYRHRVEVNALGLRGAEVPAEKAAGEVRVLALGDSLTYGQGVADADTLPARLEDELERLAPDRAWRVVNAGLRGYSTPQELGLLRELGPRIRPDVCVLLWYWNDLNASDVEGLFAELSASGPIAFDLGEPFEGRAALLWRMKQVLRRSALVMYAHDALRAREGRPTAAYVEEGLARLAPMLEEFRSLCAELGARPLLAVIPDVGSLAGEHWTAPLADRAASLAEAAGLPVVRLAPALAPLAQDGDPPILPFDGHYDPAANGAMAERLAPAVLDAAR